MEQDQSLINRAGNLECVKSQMEQDLVGNLESVRSQLEQDLGLGRIFFWLDTGYRISG